MIPVALRKRPQRGATKAVLGTCHRGAPAQLDSLTLEFLIGEARTFIRDIEFVMRRLHKQKAPIGAVKL